MSLSRRAKRRDANEDQIVKALERAGAEVWITDRPADLLVYRAGRWFVLEVKMPGNGFTARQSQDRALGLCQGVVTVTTPLEALKAIGAIADSSVAGTVLSPNAS